MQRYAVILAGGRGERFWPFSTRQHPKQFVTLFGGKSLLAQAVERLHGVVPAERIYVVTAETLVATTRAALPMLPPDQIIGEPLARDTAAAVALACGVIAQRDSAGSIAILTADHLIGDEATFQRMLADAYAVAEHDALLVTLGIAPTFPATGYGYIECGAPVESDTQTTFCKGCRFVEKPSAEMAQAYLETGAFVWNAGMFIGTVRVLCEAFERVAPQWLPLIQHPEAKVTLYPTLPKLSFDYAVMEKLSSFLVARGDFGWDDVGALNALAHHFPQDADGNTFLSPTYALDVKGCLVVANKTERPTALVEVSDLMVVQTDCVTLVCPKASAQRVKQLLETLPEDLK